MNNSSDVPDRPALGLHSEKTFPQPVHAHLLACCPTRDLIAVVTKEEQLDVYRFGEQRTFGLKRKHPDLKVTCIRWKYDGTSLLVAWSDGSIDQVYADPRLPRLISSPGICALTYLGWGTNLISPARHTAESGLGLDQALADLSLEDVLDGDLLSELRRGITNLPGMLMGLDVQRELPKLSAIPMYAGLPNSEHTEGFTSQENVDAAFHRSQLRKPPAVDIILACQDSGSIIRKIYEFMDLVPLQNPLHCDYLKYRVVSHAYHPYSPTHALITTAEAPRQSLNMIEPSLPAAVLALVPLNLRLTWDHGLGLSTAMEDIEQWCLFLKSYIVRAVHSIRAAFQQARELPARYIENINETLGHSNQGDLVPAMYHLAVTGNCPAGIKDWLSNEVDLRVSQQHAEAYHVHI